MTVAVTDAGSGVTVDAASLEVRANDGEASVRLVLKSRPAASVVITPSVSGGSHAVVSGPLTFTTGNWNEPQTVTVTGKTAGSVQLRLAVTTGDGNGGDYPTTTSIDPVAVTVTADTRPQVALSMADADGKLAEGGSTDVTATLTGGTLAGALAVPVTVSGGQAADYSFAGSIAIAAGQTSGKASISLADDALDEPTEVLTLALGALPATVRAGAASSLALSIIDGDATSVALARAPPGATAAIAENGGVAELTVTLGRALVAGETVTAPLTVSGAGIDGADYILRAKAGANLNRGVALDASDPYSADAPAIVFTGAGADPATSTVRIATLELVGEDDSIDEGAAETASLGLGSVTSNLDRVSGTGAGGTSASGTASVAITDDEATPTATLTLAPAAIDESGATNASTVTAALSGASSEVVTLAVSTSGAAHTLSQGKTLTIAAGEKASTGTVTVTATDNDVDAAADATVTVSATASGGGVAAPADVTLTVRDDDVRAVRVSKSTVTVREADDAVTADVAEHEATYTVVLDSEPTGGTVTVNVASGAAGTATVLPASLEFDATDWSTAQVMTVTGVDDDVDNAGDRRAATITHTVSAGGTDYATETASPVSVTVTDDDGPPTGITLSVDVDSVAEGATSAATVTVTATVAGGSAFDAARTVTVSVGQSADTATEGTDYAQVADFDITIPKGAKSATGSFDLTPADDDVDEGTGETVGVAGTSGSLPVTPATVTITDDDAAPGGIALSVSPSTVAEDAAGAQTVTVTATVTGTTTYAEDKVVAVRVGESTDSATSGTDYTAVPGFDITIRAGTSSGEGEFDLDPADDNLDEPGETLTVAGASGALTVTPARVTITDDDVPQVGITPGPAVTEGTAARFTVSADIAPAADLAVVLNVTGRGAFAASGATGDGKTVTLSKGATSVTYEVATLADAVDEADGAVTAALAAGTGYGIVAGQQTATVGVSDDDRTVVTLARPGTDGVAENGGTLDVTLTLGRALVAGESVVAPLAVTGATVATHYTLALKGNGGTGVSLSTAAPHSAQHPAVTLAGVGARTATLVLTAKPNADRLTRTVGIAYGTGDRRPSASGLSGGITLAGAPLSVVLVDDDAMVTVAAARAAEGSVLEFAVTLPDPAPAGGVTIDYATADGRGEAADKAYQVAVASEDYTAAGGNARLTIAKDGTGGTIRITTLEDAVYEGDHHLTLTLESSTHFNISATAGSAAGTIDDAADAPSFGFSAASGTVAEDIAAGKVTLTVEKTGTTLVPATLGWATADGTAKAGSDYSAVAAGSLVFAAGDTSKTLQVSLTDDSTDEPSEGFRVDLSATSHARLGAPASHGVTITDDDPTSVTLSAPSGAIAEATGSKVLTVTLGRALVSGESLSVPLTFGGAAAFGGDYTLAAPSPLPAGVGYAHLASTDLSKQSPTVTFTGGAGASSSATLTLTATQDTTDEGARRDGGGRPFGPRRQLRHGPRRRGRGVRHGDLHDYRRRCGAGGRHAVGGRRDRGRGRGDGGDRHGDGDGDRGHGLRGGQGGGGDGGRVHRQRDLGHRLRGGDRLRHHHSGGGHERGGQLRPRPDRRQSRRARRDRHGGGHAERGDGDRDERDHHRRRRPAGAVHRFSDGDRGQCRHGDAALHGELEPGERPVGDGGLRGRGHGHGDLGHGLRGGDGGHARLRRGRDQQDA